MRLDERLRERLEERLRERFDEPFREPLDERLRPRLERFDRELERPRDERDLRPGPFPPSRRASDSPIAIACLRLFTFLPDPPDRSVPRLRSCIAFSTFWEAFRPYLRAKGHLQVSLLQVLDRWHSWHPGCTVPPATAPEAQRLEAGFAVHRETSKKGDPRG